MHVFKWWEEAGVTGGNPQRQGEHTPHRNQTHNLLAVKQRSIDIFHKYQLTDIYPVFA